MEDYKVGYVPNASQRIQEFVEKQSALFSDLPTGYEILNYVFNGDANRVTVLAGYLASWFRLEFSFLAWITLANGMNFKYVGAYIPGLFQDYSGNYGSVFSYDRYEYVVPDDTFYLDGMKKNLAAELTYIPIYSRVELGAASLLLYEGYDPFEI